MPTTKSEERVLILKRHVCGGLRVEKLTEFQIIGGKINAITENGECISVNALSASITYPLASTL